MAVDNLLPENDFFDFTQPDNGAMIFTNEGQAQDPPGKKKPKAATATTPPQKPKKWDFSFQEKALQTYADNENFISKGFEPTLSGGTGGFSPSPMYFQQKEAQLADAKRRSKEYKQNADYYNAVNSGFVEDFIVENFGNIDEILKGGDKFSKFVTSTPRGMEVSDSAIRKLLDESVKNNGGGNYVVSQYYGQIKAVADTFLQAWQNRDRINKSIQKEINALDPETQKGVLQSQIATVIQKGNAQAQELLQQNNQKIAKLQTAYEPMVADLSMDVNFYFNQVKERVGKEFNEKWGGTTGVSPQYLQDRFNETVQEEFLKEYGTYISDNVEPVINDYIEAVNEEIAKTKNAIGRIRNQSLIEAKNIRQQFIASAEQKQKQAAVNINGIIEKEIKAGFERSAQQSKAYTSAMMYMGSTNTNFLSQIFGQSLASGYGNLKSTTATFLQSLGFEADWIDNMKYSGLDLQQEFNLGDASMKEFGFTPSYWAKVFGESIPTMAPGIVASIVTRNPRVGMILGGIMEGGQIAGDITQQVADQTGDWNKARREGMDAFVKNIPTYFLEAPIHRAVAGMAGKNIASNLAQSFFGEGAQEWLQTGAIELPATEGISMMQGLKDPRAIEAGVAGGVMGLGMSGGGIAGNMLFKSVPNPRAQVLTASVLRFGKDGAVGAAQQESLGQPDNVLQHNLQEIQLINEQVADAETMGLNPAQTQLFVAKNQELKSLQQQRVAVKDPVAAEIIDERIAEKKKEIAGVVRGETQVASIELPHGVMMSVEVPKMGEIISIPEIREGIKNGVVRIVTQDNGLNKQVEEIVKENEQAKQEENPQTQIPYEPIAEALFDAMPNVQGIYGRMLEMVVNPDQQQYVVDAVIDQYNNDFEAASARYGDKVTEMVKPFVQQEKQAANDFSNITWYRGKSNLNEQSQDSFFSASQSIAGDYGSVSELTKEERPKNPLVLGSKEDLVDEIGYDGDPLAEPLDTPVAERFDTKAREYAISKGYDAIIYESGTFDEPELHLFGKSQQPNQQPQNQNNNAEMQGQEGRQEVAPATNNAPSVGSEPTADVGGVTTPDVSPKVKPNFKLTFIDAAKIADKTVSIPVTVKETGRKVNRKMSAAKVHEDIKARYKELTQLINCVG